MKSCYYKKDAIFLEVAVADCVQYYSDCNNVLIGTLLTRLFVPELMRGKGVAKQLLSEICNDADKEGQMLFLEFAPYSETNHVLLRKLYEEFGFRETASYFYSRMPAK